MVFYSLLEYIENNKYLINSYGTYKNVHTHVMSVTQFSPKYLKLTAYTT